MVVLAGCAGVAVNTNTNAVLAESAGQVIGYKFAQQNPTLIEPALTIATGLTTDNATQDMVLAIQALAAKQFANDPLMAMEMVNLFKLVQIQQTGSVVQYDMTLVKAGAWGFIEGVTLFQQTVAPKH